MSSIDLRYYQAEAIEATFKYLNANKTNPCIVIPTGGGKTPVIAQIARKIVGWGGRVMILSHVKELLEQSANTLRRMAPDLALQIGVYSAGLKSKDYDTPIVVAGVQSACRNAYAFQKIDLVMVDEAHLIPPDGEGQYLTLLTALKVCNPKIRIIGLTATPYRMTTGMICGPDNILNEVCYEIGVRELIVQGYLSPLKSKAGTETIDFSRVAHRGGEFVEAEMQALMDQDHLVSSAVNDIVTKGADRRSGLIFCAGVDHAKHVAQVLRQVGNCEVGETYGTTDDATRADNVKRFKSGDLRYLVNVGVHTTGFDAPNVDLVVLLRATESPGLYYQMVGRGFRLSPGKKDCLVLDFGGNVMRHGPVDMIEVTTRTKGEGGAAPTKECKECHALVHISCTACPECGAEFPVEAKAPHEGQAGTAGILSGDVTEADVEVSSVTYAVHVKRDAPPGHPRTLKVMYRCGFVDRHTEWICVEHPEGSFARTKAEAWWQDRTDAPFPQNADEAAAVAEHGKFRVPVQIKIRQISGEKYANIIGYVLGAPIDPDGKCPQCGDSEREWWANNATGREQVLECCVTCGNVFRTVPDAEHTLSPESIRRKPVIADDDIPF